LHGSPDVCRLVQEHGQLHDVERLLPNHLLRCSQYLCGVPSRGGGVRAGSGMLHGKLQQRGVSRGELKPNRHLWAGETTHIEAFFCARPSTSQIGSARGPT
jgi:hypothetical protein